MVATITVGPHISTSTFSPSRKVEGLILQILVDRRPTNVSKRRHAIGQVVQ